MKGAAAAPPFFFLDALPDGDAASFFFLGGRLRFAGAGPLTAAAFCPALGLTMASWAA